MNISKAEAEKILNDYKVTEELERKKSREEWESKVNSGWENCEWIITKTTKHIFMTKHTVTGWEISQKNTYNNNVQGMFYYVTYQNVFLREGGGTHVLLEGIVITEQDVQDLNEGKIPQILKRRKINMQTGEEF